MRRSHAIVLCVLLVFLALLVGCTREVVLQEATKTITSSTAAYIGSDECAVCHASIYADFQNTGHPYKLNEAEDVQEAGYYPFSVVPSPPAGVSWNDVDKVIGGFWWKARFIGHDGFIITGDEVQYNLIDGSFTAYHSGETKPYDCGPCHMTAYRADGGNQEGKDGLIGTWEFNGVQCEECHGPGEQHQAAPFEVAMTVDQTSEQCGKCHIRGDVGKIPASGGFIKHHEQWNEMFTTKHQSLACVDCHDPHIGLHPNNPTREAAIKVTCENCHIAETESFMASGIEHYGSSAGPGCIDCHMAKAAKSALAAGPYEGDVHSHLWRINTDADAEMFTPDGAFANGYLTLEYTCLQCHASESKEWAADYAGQVHNSSVEDDGVESCLGCHNDASFGLIVAAIQDEYEYSVHSSGENTDRNRNNASFYAACEKCHTSEGFIAQATGVPASGDHFSAIDCFTCHEPHSEGDFGLRVEDAVMLADGTEFDRGDANLCASCHQSRRDVNTTVVADVELSGHWGPHHSNQADMLIGENSYEYASYTYTKSPHSNVAEDGCVDCHMSTSLHASIGSHSWNMRNEDRDFENTGGCNESTCHNGAVSTLDILAAADFDGSGTIEGIQTEVHNLLDSLHVLLEAANLLDSEGLPVDGRLVSTADSAGALYNFLFVEEDRSLGVHNTDYAVGLLQSSINFLNTGDPNSSGSEATTRRKLVSAH